MSCTPAMTTRDPPKPGRVRATFAGGRAWIAHVLLGDDVFISYSRHDGAQYAIALANRLSEAGFVCYLDQWGSAPGRELPAQLRRTLMSSSMLAVVFCFQTILSTRPQRVPR